MERMKLSEDEVQMLTKYSEGKISEDDLRKMIFASVTPSERSESETM